MHFIFLRQCFYGLLLFNGFNANFTFKFGSKFSAACFTHPDRSFRLQISILFSCLKNGEYYNNNISLFITLALSCGGNPRILLKTIQDLQKFNLSSVNQLIKEFYRGQIWAEHTELGE